MNHTLRDKIRTYLSGQMPEKERDAFEAEIQADDYLETEVEWMRLEKTMVNGLREDRMRENMQQWEKDYREKTRRRSRWRDLLKKYWFLIPLGIVVGMVIWSKFPPLPNNVNPHEPSLIPPQQQLQQASPPPQLPEVAETKTNTKIFRTPRATSVQDTTHVPITTVPVRLTGSYAVVRLNREVSYHIESLSDLSASNDWPKSLVEGKYDSACTKLRRVLDTKNINLSSQPDAWYFAALLKLYWNCDIDIKASTLLNGLSYKKLAAALPDLNEPDLIQHRVIAQYLETSSPGADSLILITPDKNWADRLNTLAPYNFTPVRTPIGGQK